MRKAIRTRAPRQLRLALPAVAAAAAFVLTGCGEEGDGPFGAEGAALESGGAGSGDMPNPEDMEDLEDIEIPGPEQTDPGSGGGTTGGDSGGTTGGDSGGSTGGGGTTGGSGGGSATVADMEGSWYTGYESADSSLSVSSGTVTFIENTEAEGDVCNGTATDGAITLEYCTKFGSVAWSAMSATVELSGSTLIVTWEDGVVQEYSGL